jgi:VanZ family protein
VFVAWGLVALCAGIILGLGGGAFAASETSRIIGPVLRWLFPSQTPAEHAAALFFLRKLAHVVEYGVFALVTLRATFVTWSATARASTLGAIALVVTLAALDESHQAVLDSRTGSPRDVLLDTLGALLALGGFFSLQRGLNKSFIRRSRGRPSS